jgi:hypothetical protein
MAYAVKNIFWRFQMKMKEHRFFAGIRAPVGISQVCILLVFALAFAGCGSGDDDSGGGVMQPAVTPPAVGSLPAFPVGTAPVASKAEAEAFFENGGAGALNAVFDDIAGVIPMDDLDFASFGGALRRGSAAREALSDNGSYSVPKTETESGFVAEAKADYSYTANLADNTSAENFRYHVGDSVSGRLQASSTGTMTRTGSNGDGYSILQGSSYEAKIEASASVAISSITDNMPTSISASAEIKAALGAGFTVSNGEQSAKIICAYSIILDKKNQTVNENYDFSQLTPLVTGYLRIYGEDNTLLYELSDDAIMDWITVE